MLLVPDGVSKGIFVENYYRIIIAIVFTPPPNYSLVC